MSRMKKHLSELCVSKLSLDISLVILSHHPERQEKKGLRAGQASKTLLLSGVVDEKAAPQGQKEASLSLTLADRMESDTGIMWSFVQCHFPPQDCKQGGDVCRAGATASRRIESS